ncbi:MAG: DUF1822 family protein [Cyanothece sp. SIO2G6]|nr:DUF1822 family protein [Cyanothece sp. SIO2G6]
MTHHRFTHLIDTALPITIPQRVWDILAHQIMPYTDLPLVKREQFLHNQLAIWAVNFYLTTLCGLTTRPPDINHINPLLALVDDHTDLDLPDLGRLDCRAVTPNQTGCDIPADVQSDRIGYVIVQIDSTTRTVSILGFSPIVHQDRIELSDLQTPEAMLDQFEALRAGSGKTNIATNIATNITTNLSPNVTTNLATNLATSIAANVQPVQRWFQQQFEEAIAHGWLTLDEIRHQILQDQPAPAYLSHQQAATSEDKTAAIASIIQLLQSSTDPTTQESALKVLGEMGQGSADVVQILTHILATTDHDDLRWQAALSLQKVDPSHPQAAVSRAKLINLGVQLNHQPVALIGTFVPSGGDRTSVFFQVHSFNRRQPLPPDIELLLLNQQNTILESVTSRRTEQGTGLDESISVLENVSSATTICVRLVARGESFEQHFAI